MTTQTITLGEGTQTGIPVSTAVIEAVTEESTVDPTALPPLYERINPEALDALFASTAADMSRAGEITFSYAGYVVTVDYDGKTAITLDG